jgi:hypothetical protein
VKLHTPFTRFVDTDDLISVGPQTAMTIQSGSEKYRFRRFHQALADLNFFSNPVRAMILSTSETVRCENKN